MNSPASKPETYSIKNSASLEEIRGSDVFKHLNRFIEDNEIERETRQFPIAIESSDSKLEVPDQVKISRLKYLKILAGISASDLLFKTFARKTYNGIDDLLYKHKREEKFQEVGIDPAFCKKYDFLHESIELGTIEGISFNELRNLKQALNNQICLYLFDLFLKEISELGENEIPCIDNKKGKSINLYGISLKDFIRVNDKQGNLPDMWNSHGIAPHIMECWTSIAGKIVLLTGGNDFRLGVINAYLNVFVKMVYSYSDTNSVKLFQGKIGSGMQDIVDTYLFLENFIMSHTIMNDDLDQLCSITGRIHINSNRNYLSKFLSQQTEQNGKLPDLNDIKDFLFRQRRDSIRRSKNSKTALAEMHNANQVGYDIKSGVVAALSSKISDGSRKLDGLGGCPFAKSQIQGSDELKNQKSENAFLKMYETFDNYFLMIIEELNKRGFK